MFNILNFFKKEEPLQDWVKENSYQLRKWSKSVREKCDNTCTACERVELPKDDKDFISFHAHHVVPKNIDRSMAFDVDNGELLCPVCHINGSHAWHKVFRDDVGDRTLFNRWVLSVRARRDGKLGVGGYLADMIDKMIKVVVFLIGVGVGVLVLVELGVVR